MSIPVIIGDGVIPEAEAFRDIQRMLHGCDKVVLLSHMAGILGQSIPDDAIVYNFEPLFDGCRSFSVGYMDVLKNHEVWDYQAENVAYLARHGIEARHVPYRYDVSLERHPVETNKDIDVLFFGSMSPRRAHILADIENVVIASGRYGAALDEMVSRAKVVVNIHYCDWPHPLEVVRLNYLMANKCCVVSEEGWDRQENDLYRPGVIFSGPDQIADRCCAMVADHDCCTAQGFRAQETIRSMSTRIPS